MAKAKAVSPPGRTLGQIFRWTVPGTDFGFIQLSILVFAGVVFFTGASMAYLSEEPDNFAELVKACIQQPVNGAICAAKIDELHEVAFGTHPLYWEAFAEALKALAIAVVVTVGVTSIFDARNRQSLNAALTQKAQDIGINVFDALFGNDHSRLLLEKLKLDILFKPIVREILDVTYVLTDIKGTRRLSGRSFTAMTATVSCKFKNVATVPGIPTLLPLAVSLPNPLIDELKKLTILRSAKIERDGHGIRILSAEEIEQANVALQSALQDDSAPEGMVSFGELTLNSGESGGFEVEYVMIKEAEDSELLRCFHTTNDVQLTVIDHTGRNLHIRAKAIHSNSLNVQGAPIAKVSKWSLTDIFLPQQGVMIWWKEHPVKPGSRARLPKAKPA